MNSFALHERLAADTMFLIDWKLSRVLLMNDARFPWLVVVPRMADLIEIFDLEPSDRITLIDEVSRASVGLKTLVSAAKINVGALGNLVPQLHVHVVARNPGDAAWPGPVWGQGMPRPYETAAKDELIVRLREMLGA